MKILEFPRSNVSWCEEEVVLIVESSLIKCLMMSYHWKHNSNRINDVIEEKRRFRVKIARKELFFCPRPPWKKEASLSVRLTPTDSGVLSRWRHAISFGSFFGVWMRQSICINRLSVPQRILCILCRHMYRKQVPLVVWSEPVKKKETVMKYWREWEDETCVEKDCLMRKGEMG